MAQASITNPNREKAGADDFRLVAWNLLQADATGDAVELASHMDRTVQVEGNFGGGSIVFEGSNDGTNYRTLTNHLGDDLTFAQGKVQQVVEATRFVRPRSPAPGSGLDVIVTVFARRSKAA